MGLIDGGLYTGVLFAMIWSGWPLACPQVPGVPTCTLLYGQRGVYEVKM